MKHAPKLSNSFLHLSVLICLSLQLGGAEGSATIMKNRPELELPLSNEKLVIAHNMPAIMRFKGYELEDSCDPEYYPPTGNITSELGGLVQVYPIVHDYLKDATLEEAVEFELMAAHKLGIDGFQFYYPLRKRGPEDLIIKAYFHAAKKLGIDFKFTFCPSHPSKASEPIKVAEYIKRMNGIFDEVGHDNPHWLRTPDGRLIIYLWYGEQIADVPPNADRPRAFYVARAWDKVAQGIEEEVAYLYSINRDISDQDLHDYLDYFPAVWLWTLPYTADFTGKRVAAVCRERQRTYTGSVFNGFYTSKVYPKGTWDMHHYARHAANANLETLDRRGIVTGLSYNYRKLWEFAIEEDVPLVNFITWNDYPEGHHIAPEINSNYGWVVLLEHYKSVWRGTPSPYEGKDVAAVFFKKYRHDVTPHPFNIPISNIAQAVPESDEDVIEVVSILKEDGLVTLNGEDKMASSGLDVNRFEHKPGPVELRVSRDERTQLYFQAPEWITDKPYRTDRMIYVFSSEYHRYHHALFGDFVPIQSVEQTQIERTSFDPLRRRVSHNSNAGKATPTIVRPTF